MCVCVYFFGKASEWKMSYKHTLRRMTNEPPVSRNRIWCEWMAEIYEIVHSTAKYNTQPNNKNKGSEKTPKWHNIDAHIPISAQWWLQTSAKVERQRHAHSRLFPFGQSRRTNRWRDNNNGEFGNPVKSTTNEEKGTCQTISQCVAIDMLPRIEWAHKYGMRNAKGWFNKTYL